MCDGLLFKCDGNQSMHNLRITHGTVNLSIGCMH